MFFRYIKESKNANKNVLNSFISRLIVFAIKRFNSSIKDMQRADNLISISLLIGVFLIFNMSEFKKVSMRLFNNKIIKNKHIASNEKVDVVD